jgi:hypothetical protein
MRTEIGSIISHLENVLSGEPWFGRAVYDMLDEVDSKKGFQKPNGTEHSMIEIIYHMITWADFTLKRIEKDANYDLTAAEEIDWRLINPKTHTWKKGIAEFKKEDSFLYEKVDFRNYNYRFLLNGMIEHSIYHLGQIAYINKMMA